jgi:HTH-type transcriptional regulator, transcriptional repressor of NAD biosynthesis genes
MRFRSAVVIGKFYPPHRGHHFLINTATAQTEQVTVIVCHKAEHAIPGELRGSWLREIHPGVDVRVIDDAYDDHDSALWARLTREWLGDVPDAVFTSEDYGDRYAACLGSTHVQVDKARVTVPCSGSAIRLDPFAHWDYLEPPVRFWFVKRVCVLGAESTGTTTLAKELAAALDTCWVPEYGREYSVDKQKRGENIWTTDEFTYIAREQCRREDEAARRANKILICDTNAFATRLWHRRYMGCESDAVAAIAAANPCDFYLLTGDEIPFVQDGLRDGEHIRHQMHDWFVEALGAQSVGWQLVQGLPEKRLDRGLKLVGHIMANGKQTTEGQPHD